MKLTYPVAKVSATQTGKGKDFVSKARIALGLGLLTVDCGAASRMPDAQVRQAGNLPCFSVADDPETRVSPPDLFALVVESREPVKRIWSFVYKPGRSSKLGPNQCLVYGVVPAGAAAAHSAPPLETGVVYRVFLNARPTKRSPIQGYATLFCLVQSANFAVQVRQIEWDSARRRWRTEACAT